VNAASIAKVLNSTRFRFADERQLQDGIELALLHAGASFTREKLLGPGDIVDFLVGDVALEVKIGGSLSEVTRQLHRYTQHESVASILLVSSRMRLDNLPAVMNGKPLQVVRLLGSIL
jgi:hypothetical protein